MVHEYSSLLVAPVEALDGALFAAYEDIGHGGTETYSRLLPASDVAAARKAEFFAKDRDITPDLRPTNLDAAQLADEAQVLREFKAIVSDLAPDASIAQAYTWAVNERLGNVAMLQAIESDDPRRFDAYNNFIYGTPDKDVFGAAVDWLCTDAEQAEAHDDPEVRSAAWALLENFDAMRGDSRLIVPSEETFQTIRDQHFQPGGFYDLLLEDVKLSPDARVTTNEGDPALLQVLKNLKSDYTVADAAGAAWSISGTNREVRRPKKYDLAYERLVGLGLGHEVGSHLLESVNGRRSAVQLAGKGLDRSDAGNEGRAVMREQIMYPTFEDFAKTQRWQVILRRAVTTGLGLGASGRDMEFPEVFEHINSLDTLYERRLKLGATAVADTKAASRSYSVLQEVYKGTDGRSGPYRRYKLYAEGNAACWNLAVQHPERIPHGDLGKYDITNRRHTDFLEQKGVIPTLSPYNEGVHDAR